MIGYFARHPTAANLLMLVFVLLGALALPQLRRETFPQFETDTIRISASYPGAPAEIVDTSVTQRIEAEVAGLPGVANIHSQSREGAATLSVESEDGVEVDVLAAEIESAVAGIRDLPDEVERPRVNTQRRMESVASIAVTGPMSAQDLKLYCEQLKRELLRRPEITQISVAGFSAHRLRVRADRAALASHGLTLSDLSAALSAQNLDAPIGNLQAHDGSLLVRYSGRRSSPQQLAELVIRSTDTGGTVRLGDVADIEDVFAVDEERTYFNGERAGMLNISKTPSQDSLDVVRAVKDFIADQEYRKPDGVKLTLTSDTASVIKDRLGLLVTNGVQGLLLVFCSLWLFFDLRLAFWVAAGLPVAFLGALWVMLELGQTLNMMSMMGLLVALGLLMDDAIVLADNVAAHLARGKSALAAVIDGVKEVAGGILSSFVTTACVFIPLSTIDGRIGRTLQVIPFVLIAVLAVSLVEAFFILPNHLAHSLQPVDERAPNRFRAAFERQFARFRERGLGRCVDFAVKHRHITAAAAIALLLVSVGMVTSGRLRYQAFPDAEGDVVQFKLELPPGTPLERTREEVRRVVDAAWQVSAAEQARQPDSQPLVRNVSARFNYNPDADDGGPHVATVSVDLLSVEVRATALDEFSRLWREAVGPLPSAVSASFGAGGRRGPGGNPIEVRIEGSHLEQLEQAAGAIREYFSGFAGVFDLTDDLQPGSPQIVVRLRPTSSSTGLTGAAVTNQLRSAIGGISVERLFQRGEEYELFVELERHGRDSIADLESFPIVLPAGGTVPLGAIATIETSRSFAAIRRANGSRTATVAGNLDRHVANAASLMQQFQREKVPELTQQFPDVHFALGGEAEDSAKTLGSMGRKLIVGLFFMFVLLSLQFKSYVEPLLVMVAVPFAFVGVVWGSLLIGAPLSSQSILGLTSLAGVAVNDSILLVLFLKQARQQGMNVAEAARSASRQRFRAVLLTSLTTVAGLVPIMFETSRQAQSLIPVATSIVFGISASTVLILIVLPAIYTLLGDLGGLPAPGAAEPNRGRRAHERAMPQS